MLSQWVIDLQFSDAALPSYGALKIHHTPSAMGAEGTPFYRVSPYVSNLGVMGLVSAKRPQHLQTAKLWIDWYLAHLTPQSAPDGVPLEHFYRADGGGETTCVRPGDAKLCRYNDATDSAAATFFCVLRASREAGVPDAFFLQTGRREKIENLAGVLLQLQQKDGLCWAKSDYRVKYLEDNSEVFAGLRDLAAIERSVFHDEKQARFYTQAAERVRAGIIRELYDANAQLYRIAKFEDGTFQTANLAKWYPDTQAQMWPHLWGVVAPKDAKSQAVVKALNTRWNERNQRDWATNPGAVNDGWIESGVAYAMFLAGDETRLQNYVAAVRRLKFPTPGRKGFDWPFSLADAGWLLRILARF